MKPPPHPAVVLVLESIDIPGAPADLHVPTDRLGDPPWVVNGEEPKVGDRFPGLPEIKLLQAAKPGTSTRRHFPRFTAPRVDIGVLVIGPYRTAFDLGQDDAKPDLITGVDVE